MTENADDQQLRSAFCRVLRGCFWPLSSLSVSVLISPSFTHLEACLDHPAQGAVLHRVSAFSSVHSLVKEALLSLADKLYNMTEHTAAVIWLMCCLDREKDHVILPQEAFPRSWHWTCPWTVELHQTQKERLGKDPSRQQEYHTWWSEDVRLQILFGEWGGIHCGKRGGCVLTKGGDPGLWKGG